MACPVCGAQCRCRKAGEGGLCCGCHRHSVQKGMTRTAVDTWRAAHRLAPIPDDQWRRQFEQAPTRTTLPFEGPPDASSAV
jgi:hypothetical protein